MRRLENVAISPSPVCQVQVIGFGMAGLGIALAADRHHCLKTLCANGLVYLDKNGADQFQSLHFDMASNSPASDFIESICPEGEFSSILHHANGKVLRALKRNKVPLTLVSQFFSEIAHHLVQSFHYFPRSQLISNTHVTSLKYEKNGAITSLDARGRSLVTSKFAIVATGGIEKPNHAIHDIARALLARFQCSETILRGDDGALYQTIKAGKTVVIIGGSHSAFSVVDYVLRRFGLLLTRQQVVVVSRSAISSYYDNVGSFYHDQGNVGRCLIDVETLKVNRYCGLRGDAKKVYRTIASGDEQRVRLVSEVGVVNLELIKSLAVPVGMVIQATGYHSYFPKIIDKDGLEIQCRQSRGRTALSNDYTVCMENGDRLHRLFGIGLGSFVPSALPYSVTGEIPAGVNRYHQKEAAIIMDNIVKGNVALSN